MRSCSKNHTKSPCKKIMKSNKYFHKKLEKRFISYLGLFNNYVTLELPIQNHPTPPPPHHHALPCLLTRPPCGASHSEQTDPSPTMQNSPIQNYIFKAVQGWEKKKRYLIPLLCIFQLQQQRKRQCRIFEATVKNE